MPAPAPINIKSFKAKANRHKKSMTKFLRKFDKKFIPGMLSKQLELNEQVWQEVDCLSCANCCKTMTPTFTKEDTKRIAAHLGITTKELYNKYFEKDEDNGDIVNKKQPCQWLNLKDNKCSIYEVRPVDCSGFPHHTKKRFDNYNHVYEQNIDKCPATFAMVQKLQAWVEEEYKW
ncbi:MAG: hypothetical protein RL660_966 [Bacteroidota bacterium]|jgi:Fe-S-cluster containining protein